MHNTISSDNIIDREILSESYLQHFIRQENHCFCDFTSSPETVLQLTQSEIINMSDEWLKDTKWQAKQLIKRATSNLEHLPNGCMYNNLEKKDWKNSALISEIFRDPSISKNSGRLDTYKLQEKIYKATKKNDHLQFVIGWGQPKRSAGGIKTEGTFADLAEVYAIGRLACLIKAVSNISHIPVQLLVFTGGSRFYPAYFMRKTITEEYDSQRQRIADIFFRSTDLGSIIFKNYSDLTGEFDNNLSFKDTARQIEFKKTIGRVDDALIASKFNTILLNIDWNHIFSKNKSDRLIDPHDIAIPPELETWLYSADKIQIKELIRATIVSLINPKCQASWHEKFCEHFDQTLQFVQAVTWESTKKYIALHLMDSDDAASIFLKKQGIDCIRLTVHEKKDRNDIPAIYTLGKQAGNLLSQHVISSLKNTNKIRFETYAEAKSKQLTPVYIADKECSKNGYLFDWLKSNGQPLLYVGKKDFQTNLGQLFKNSSETHA